MSFFPPRRLRRNWMTIALWLTGPVALAGFVFLWIGSSRFIIPKRRPLEDRHHQLLAAPAEFGLELEPIAVKLPDGVVLQTILATRADPMGFAEKTRHMESRLVEAGVIPPSGGRGTIVLLHGRGGLKENMLSVAQRFVAADFRCLVYDARAHGQSGGRFCTFGKKETEDLSFLLSNLESILSARGESAGPFGVFGNSLGAAVILQALSTNPKIEAAVTVAPFAELPEIVIRSSHRTIHPSLPEFLIRGPMKLGGWRAGFDPSSIVPSNAVAGVEVPIYLMHGMKDEVIPPSHSLRILDSLGSKEKVWREIPEGYHSNVLAEGGDDHYQEMIEFFIRHLEPTAGSPGGNSLTDRGSQRRG
jgi:alpha-beta hydrolase superfamily lysophospholipase